ncbi:hypothetical protein ACWCQZ_01225 [Streptomyces sp. NPDC002285]
MDSTEAARRFLGGDAAPVSYVVPVTGVRGQPSIYAALVAEWQANGRAVPRRHAPRWDSLATAYGQEQAVTSWTVGRFTGLARAVGAEPAGERHVDVEATDRVPAVVVPRGLPGPVGLWEWSGSNGRVSVAAPRTDD